MELIIGAILFSLIANIVMFIPAYLLQTDKLTDISYAVTFALVAVYGFLMSSMELIHLLVMIAVLLWSIRLGSFLFIRINYIKRDKRFDGRREYFWKFLSFWLLQGLTVGVVMIAPLIAFQQESISTTAWTYIGLLIFVVGLLLEATADNQKFNFNKKPKNKNRWIEQGVWKISRHPNYLGEMMVWTGLFLAISPSLNEWWYVLIAAISPLYIISLLLFVSGVPLLEKSSDKKWGGDKSYENYKRRTPVVFPTIESIKRSLAG